MFGHDAQLWDVIRAGVVATVNGAGQGQPHYLVRGSVFFQHEDGELDYRSTVLYVAEPFEGNAEMESVLGRDVLGHYKAVFDRNRDLTLE